jgi:hypothetical protein
MGPIPLIAIVGALGATLIGTLYFLWVRASKAK